MAVYDTAHELARAMQESDEYKRYLKAKERIKEKEQSYRMLQHFRRLQLEVQTAQLGGRSISDEQRQELEELYQVLQFQPLVQDFFEAEARLIQMVADVQGILSRGVDLELGLGGDEAEEGAGDRGGADGESPLWVP